MRQLLKRPIVILAIALCAQFATGIYAWSADLSDDDLKEIRRIEAALADGTLPQPPGWTFNHAASKEGERELSQLGYPNPDEKLEVVVQRSGNWAKYKADAAALLTSKDPVVRGFMAIWVADLGDRQYVPHVLQLLKTNAPVDDELTPRDWDRGMAACALGVLNATDHAQDLVDCLQHESPYIRGGAARGLSWMKATKHSPEIAALLSDRDDEVVCSAIDALARLNATQYVDQITVVATSPEIAYQQNHIAMYALVEMGAKDQAAAIAKLMEDNDAPLIRGHAILCIALLDGQDFAGKIASHVDVEDVRDEAMMALGIMRKQEFADKIATHLSAANRVTRQAAVWSLIMMEDEGHASDALAAFDTFNMEQSGLLHRTGEASDRRLKIRFDESMKKLKQSAK